MGKNMTMEMLSMNIKVGSTVPSLMFSKKEISLDWKREHSARESHTQLSSEPKSLYSHYSSASYCFIRKEKSVKRSEGLTVAIMT